MVGVVAKVSAGLFSRLAICVAQRDATLEVLLRDDEPSAMTKEAFSAGAVIPVSDATLSTASGRLMAAAQAVKAGKLKPKWSVERVTALARQQAETDLGARRGAALDWLLVGAEGELATLALSATELTWYRAWLAARAGNPSAMLEHLGRLPAESYLAKLSLLMSRADDLLADATLRSAALEIAGPHAATTVEAAALVQFLAPQAAGSILGAAHHLAQLLHSYDPQSGSALMTLMASVWEQRPVQISNPESLPLTDALSRYHFRRHTGTATGDPVGLQWLPLPLLDDLVDARALSREEVLAMKIDEPSRTYLRARIDPGSVSFDQLGVFGYSGELARRCYFRGDAATLASFPEGNGAAQHYRALLAIRAGQSTTSEGLRPGAKERVDEVLAYLASLKDGPAPPPRTLVEDPTMWRLALEPAVAGKVVPPREPRIALFDMWLGLCKMERLVFAGDWATIHDIGPSLEQVAGNEPLQGEALNIAAYAQFQSGDSRGAIGTLQRALTGRYTEALIVNASIVAATLGSDFAAVFLARVFEEAPDPSVGLTAVSKAVHLWLADPDSPKLPPVLAQVMHTALSRPLPDHTLQLLIRVASLHDRAWLAADPLVATSDQGQASMVHFYVVRAKAMEPGYPDTLTEVARVLVEAHRVVPLPEWVVKEHTKLVDDLIELVHVEFGEAAWCSGAIEQLMNGHFMTLAEEIVLGAQAGAHVAVQASETGDTLTEAAEHQFLFMPYHRFLSESSSIPTGIHDVVEDELAKCLGIAGNALTVSAQKRMNVLAANWDSLVDRERYDYQNRPAILRAESAILDEMTTYVEHCRWYEQRLARLRRNEQAQLLYTDLCDDINRWNHEITRLRATL